MQLDAGLLTNAWSATAYYAQMLGRACRLSNPHKELTPIVEKFLSEVLFEHKVDLYSGEIDHRMRDMDVIEHFRAAFTPLIMSKIIQKKQRRRISHGQRLSTWKPYQATSTEKRPAVPVQNTMFNLVPCENEFEQSFADFCDIASDVAAFAKNAGPQKLMIDYLRPDGHRALYIPDFLVRIRNGDYLLCELKGKVDLLVPVKIRAAVEWCKTASSAKGKWRCLYLPYNLFQQSAAATMEELLRACEPSLKTLLEEATGGQQALPFIEAKARKEMVDLFERVVQQAGLTSAPKAIEDAMRQAVGLLDHAIRSRMPDYAHAFQPLLHPLDEYAIRILSKYLAPKIPNDSIKRHDYFNPFLENLPHKERILLERNGRYLEHNLVFGRPIQKLGTLLFCLAFVQEGTATDAAGVWRDVKPIFGTPEMISLYTDLKEVNTFRNTRVAHVETKLDNPEEAWEAMKSWLRCLNKMADATN